LSTNHSFIPFKLDPLTPQELEQQAVELNQQLQKRRSCRAFSDKPVPRSVIENLLKLAGSAPSGAHKQPWRFVAISNPALKAKIRAAAEQEEKAFYQERAPQEWLKDLEPLGTQWQKPFLETAPWLIVIFKKLYGRSSSGKEKYYYVNESVGIACGFLISALHQCGLATLTHTPSPLNFLSDILERPQNEKPFLLLPVGFPANDAQVPNLSRKTLDETSLFFT